MAADLDPITRFMVDVATARVEKTIDELFAATGVPADLPVLEKVTILRSKLDAYQLVVIPDLDKGDFKTVRAVRFESQVQKISFESALSEIQQGESDRLEFKSSLLFDCDKAAANPGLAPGEKTSESVVFASLKTLAAFLNTGGGVLYIGVADSGEILGLDNDFSLPKTKDSDTWELFLRDKVKTSFKDGNQVNDWIQISIINGGDKKIARIVVTPRDQLSYLRMPDKILPADTKFRLFRRQGNRTSNVEIYELEEFADTRRRGKKG